MNRSVVNVETMAQKKICQDSFMFQKEDTSSMEKRSPPTGAPKAEATPAAAPALMKFLLLMVTGSLTLALGFRWHKCIVQDELRLHWYYEAEFMFYN